MTTYLVSAQSLSTLAPAICKSRSAVGMVSKTLEGYGSTHYLYSEAFFAAPSKQQRSDALFAINAENSDVTQASIVRPKDIEFLDAIENEDEVIGFYTDEDTKEGTYTLYMNKISKSEGSPAWDPILLNTFPYEKKDNTYIYMAVSPDRTKAVLGYLSSAKKGNFKGAVVMTFDNTGERIWDTELELDFSNRTFQILDILITNDAEVYVPIVSYKVPAKNTRSEEKLHIYEVTSNNVNSRSENITFGHISNGRMIQTRDGNLCLGGYYMTNVKENENGSYMVKYDARYSNFANVAHQNFPASYKEKVVSKLFANTIANQNCYVKADKLVEFENGSVALVGEQRNMTVVVDNKGTTTYNYFAKNILFTLADENADIKEFKMFQKDQTTATGTPKYRYEELGLSYYIFFKNNKLYMLYADNIDNLMGESGNQIRMFMNNKHCTALMTVDENGESSTRLVINSKVAKGRMLAPLFMEDDGFVLIFVDKKAANICKLNVEL
jgi:hypothetical protein